MFYSITHRLTIHVIVFVTQHWVVITIRWVIITLPTVVITIRWVIITLPMVIFTFPMGNNYPPVGNYCPPLGSFYHQNGKFCSILALFYPFYGKFTQNGTSTRLPLESPDCADGTRLVLGIKGRSSIAGIPRMYIVCVNLRRRMEVIINCQVDAA